MDICVNGEDLRHHETGGGYRSVIGHVTVDMSLPEERQFHSLMVETLGCALDYVASEERLNDLADMLRDAWLQWREIVDREYPRVE